MKSYLNKHHRIFGGIGALTAFVVAIIYLLVVPEESSDADWTQKVILLYGHSLCWFLLSGVSILWAVNRKNKWSALLAYMALTVYALFMGTLLIAKL